MQQAQSGGLFDRQSRLSVVDFDESRYSYVSELDAIQRSYAVRSPERRHIVEPKFLRALLFNFPISRPPNRIQDASTALRARSSEDIYAIVCSLFERLSRPKGISLTASSLRLDHQRLSEGGEVCHRKA